jgi:hypothetical protein
MTKVEPAFQTLWVKNIWMMDKAKKVNLTRISIVLVYPNKTFQKLDVSVFRYGVKVKGSYSSLPLITI